jgi:hypothetical protein
MTVRSLGRIDLQIGEALRLEMVDPADETLVHVQYHIVTEYGGWALWVSCPPDEIAALDSKVDTTTSPVWPDASG